MAAPTTCREDVENVADHLSDIAQMLMGLIAIFDVAGPEDRARRSFLIASRLRLLAESLTPQDSTMDQKSKSESTVQLSEDLLTLAGETEEIVQRATHVDGILERTRIRIICEVSRLRLVITLLANELNPGPRALRFLDFPIEA